MLSREEIEKVKELISRCENCGEKEELGFCTNCYMNESEMFIIKKLYNSYNELENKVKKNRRKK